ncbi:MAG: CHC2 zinc finger domain-containing protein, partial [Cyanobium sp. ELA507]
MSNPISGGSGPGAKPVVAHRGAGGSGAPDGAPGAAETATGSRGSRPQRPAASGRHQAPTPAQGRQPKPPAHQRSSALPDSLIEAVRSQARIADLFPLSELRRSGSGYLATCPWHQDRRPSLTVNPERNRVHCFVCNRGADPIAWLEDRQGLSFREAVEELARRYAIPLPEQDPEAAARAEAEHQERQRLREWRSQQEEEFHQALVSDLQTSGAAALYLQQRGISPDTAIAWRLGLNASRLMLPIRDGQGRCCGFSGRSLNGEEPKYRNSSADLLFQKSQLLFGLDQAAAAIHSTGEALLVEGPLDVIQLHQAGFGNAVAAMGTALTLEQLQLLQRRGARRLLVVFDGDGAGTRATGKLITGLRSALIGSGLELAVVELPTGTDPDGLIRSHGPDALRRPIEQARHWLQWELDQLLAPLSADADNLSVLQRCEAQARELLAVLPPGALRERAERRLQEALGVVPQLHPPRAKGTSTGRPQEQQPQANPASSPPPAHGDAAQIERAKYRALRLFLCSPVCRDPLAVLVVRNDLYRRAQQCLVQV